MEEAGSYMQPEYLAYNFPENLICTFKTTNAHVKDYLSSSWQSGESELTQYVAAWVPEIARQNFKQFRGGGSKLKSQEIRFV